MSLPEPRRSELCPLFLCQYMSGDSVGIGEDRSCVDRKASSGGTIECEFESNLTVINLF